MSFEATFPKLWSTTGCPGEPWIYKINLRIYKVVNILISSLFQALFRLESFSFLICLSNLINNEYFVF